jgi:glycosyltransferase involved in cell wall biosynthesis
MITYNHGAYLADAINGVLAQNGNFEVELIIADDCSLDNTQRMVESFSDNKNYNWIKYIRHSSNKGMMANFIWALQQASGNYIALCEGDDYWTDVYKLQRQVDFLENNSDYSGVFHNVEERWVESGNCNLYNGSRFFTEPQKITTTNVLGFNIVPTCSLVFRKSAFDKYYNLLKWSELDYGDWPLVVCIIKSGPLFFIPYVSAVRRMNRSSIWGMQNHKENITKTIRTRGLIKNSGLLSIDLIVEMEKYEFDLFLDFFEIDDPKITKIIKRTNSLNYRFVEVINKCYFHFYRKKFRASLSNNFRNLKNNIISK